MVQTVKNLELCIISKFGYGQICENIEVAEEVDSHLFKIFIVG